jgi:hypothetical protein
MFISGPERRNAIKCDLAPAAVYYCCQVLVFRARDLRSVTGTVIDPAAEPVQPSNTHTERLTSIIPLAAGRSCFAQPALFVAITSHVSLYLFPDLALSDRHVSCLPCNRADLPCTGVYRLFSLSPCSILLKPLRLPAAPDPAAAPASFA